MNDVDRNVFVEARAAVDW